MSDRFGVSVPSSYLGEGLEFLDPGIGAQLILAIIVIWDVIGIGIPLFLSQKYMHTYIHMYTQ